MTGLKIISLLPAATEIIYLLGLEKNLVGVSDNCDYPPQVKKLPKLTKCLAPNNLTSREIDSLVKQKAHQGSSISHLDQNILKQLTPNLILTQEVCKVCATPFTEVKKAARFLDGDVKILSLEPESINDVLENILTVGEYTDRKRWAIRVVNKLRQRLQIIKQITKNKPHKKVLIIEWLDPIYIAAHWVPEMVQLAGGINLLTKPKQRSPEISWKEILRADPDILILAPCGFNINRTKQEIGVLKNKTGWSNLKAARTKQVYLVDGNSFFTRPGPRLIDGVEILAKIFHPDLEISTSLGFTTL